MPGKKSCEPCLFVFSIMKLSTGLYIYLCVYSLCCRSMSAPNPSIETISSGDDSFSVKVRGNPRSGKRDVVATSECC